MTFVYANPTTQTIMPATETTLNGVPESKLNNSRQPRDVIGRIFHSYSNNSRSTVPYFKLIATFAHNNLIGSEPDDMTATVTRSTSQGSEWTFSGSTSAKFKVKILGELEATLGLSFKDSRVTNEAVGYTAHRKVPVGKIGHIDVYYEGEKIGGVATYKQFYTANPSSVVYYKEDVNATVYNRNYVAINSKGYDTSF